MATVDYCTDTIPITVVFSKITLHTAMARYGISLYFMQAGIKKLYDDDGGNKSPAVPKLSGTAKVREKSGIGY